MATERSMDRFAAAAMGAADLCAAEIPKPRSLLGASVLVERGFAVLYGKPGNGKSWVALQAALAWARGEPWFGLPTAPEGLKVGLVQLELGKHSTQLRLRTLGAGTHPRDDGLRVVCRQDLPGAVDLCQPEHMEELRHWVREDRLDVLILDAFSRAHTASENKSEELGPVLAALDALRHDTGCALMLVHHERKSTGSGPDDDMDALRGHSRLQSDPTLHMRLKKVGGLRCLVFVKVTEGAEPAAVWFRLREDGRPEVVTPPEAKADGNRERVLQAVLSAFHPVSRGELAAALDLDRATVTRHLRALTEARSVERFGDNRTTRYQAPTGAPAQPAQHDPRAGVEPQFSSELFDSVPSTGAAQPVRTEGHRRTGATGAPKGAPGSALVHLGAPPLRPAVEPVPNVASESPCPYCGGRVMPWTGFRACRDCHRQIHDAGNVNSTEVPDA